MMEDEREEGEIVDLNDDIYENIISSDEDVDEDDLRQRIEELEAKNSELEKIASISKTYDYGLGYGSSNFINLADDDDDDSYYRQPSKYDYTSYASSSRKRSRSRRRKTCRHECKKSKRYKPYKSERRKKALPNKAKDSSDSSSDDEFELDRSKLQAALKRNTSSNHSSTLKRKLIGVSKTVEDFIKAKEDVEAEDISTSMEILHLLNKINNETIAPQNEISISEEVTESCLNEQELRIIALKSAILKKAEVRKKRKIIEAQPYSPTDTDIVMENVITTKTSVNSKPKDELDNMEISPAVSPTIEDGSLQPIDMELESDDESQTAPIISDQPEVISLLSLPIENVSSKDLQKTIIVPDEMSLSTAKVPEESNQSKSSLISSQQRKQQEEEEEQALRASLLAGLKVSKRGSPSNKSQPNQKPLEDSVPLDKSISDASTETEQLRKQVFSSIQKRRNSHRHFLPNPFAQKFSVHVPKPMEMSMPQITSNLKEALKRIKERDKQNTEATSNGNCMKVDIAKFNRTTETSNVQVNKSKKVQIDSHGTNNTAIKLNGDNGTTETSNVQVSKSKKVQIDSNETKNTAIKLNGDNVSIKANTNDSTKLAKKTLELTIKTNEVLKTVTCNNSSAAELTNKTNEVLKTVPCKNVSLVECKIKDTTTVPLVISNKIEAGSLEKSDAALRSLKAIALKKASEPHISLNQKENQQLGKVGVIAKRASEEKLAIAKKTKVTTAKVSRVITTPVEKTVKKMIIQLNNSDTESDDFGLGQLNEPIVNSKSYSGVASPASHSFSPSSPSNVIEKSSNANSTINDSFQRKLDEYLKSARTKVDQTKQETKPLKRSPSLVSHLPPSSQLEYRKLISRMAMLEKQKLLKISKLTVAASKSKTSSSINVSISNDLCNQQPKRTDEQIVQLNGNDGKSSTENKTIPSQTVDLDVSMESSETTPTHMETTVALGAIKSNHTKLQEIGAQLMEPKNATPQKRSNNIQSFSALSENDKNKLLHKTESEYMIHSKLYLVDLNNMSLLVSKAREEKEKQFQIESEIEELDLKVQQLKKQLAEQKMCVSKLYPVISFSHKDIMKKRSKSLQLNKKCYYVGNKIVGADYRIPDDPKADIAQKVKSLSSETKLLRNMKKPVATELSTSNAPVINIDAKTIQKELVNHTPAVVSAAISNCSEKPVEEQYSSINCTLDIPNPYSIMKYQSPLDHMKNIGITNPDSIVCPFQLLGQCEDKECTYQHLS